MQSIIALQFAAIFVVVRKGAYKNHKNVAHSVHRPNLEPAKPQNPSIAPICGGGRNA